MGAWREAIEPSIDDADLAKLTSIARARTEPVSRVERARMLLAYRENPSFYAVGQALGIPHQTVQRCVERTLALWSDSGPGRPGPSRPGPPSRPRPRPGWCRWPAARPRTWVIRMNCGRRGFWPGRLSLPLGDGLRSGCAQREVTLERLSRLT